MSDFEASLGQVSGPSLQEGPQPSPRAGCEIAGLAPSVGIGFRPCHGEAVLKTSPSLSHLELIAENHLSGDRDRDRELDQIASRYPLSIHGVTLSLGSADALSREHLLRLKTLCDRYQPLLVSEHLCWSSVHGIELHELLPLPYTEETVRHVSRRIAEAQNILGRRILIENVSTYLNFRDSTLTEWEFLAAVSRAADCDVLLDVSNIFVNSHNHGFAPERYLAGVPWERVREFHLGGFETREGYLLDAHSAPIAAPVWELWQRAVAEHPGIPTTIEWDNDIPPLDALLAEVRKARALVCARDLNAEGAHVIA